MEEVLSWDALYVPQTFKGFSTFFGVAAFSYGATVIIPEIQARDSSLDAGLSPCASNWTGFFRTPSFLEW